MTKAFRQALDDFLAEMRKQEGEREFAQALREMESMMFASNIQAIDAYVTMRFNPLYWRMKNG